LQSARGSEDKIDWAKFFDSNSIYRLLYTLQIVEAVMEEGEGEGLEKIEVVDLTLANQVKKPPPPAPPLPGAGVLPPGVTATPTPELPIILQLDAPEVTTQADANPQS
jgi:hypothetical protein